MAEPGRTVRVSGLPTDIEDDKLKDQLFIHFLRARNGGGEIDSVIIVKATPVSALITFEESRVAQRVIHSGQHTLDINGKKYQLAVAEHHERPDPDKVIPQLSATVRYDQLPGGIIALTNICRNHRDVDANHVATEEYCILSGAYSKVQAVLSELLGHPESSEALESKTSSEAASGVLKQLKPLPQDPEHQRTKPNKHKDKSHSDKPPVEYNSSSDRDLTPGGYDWKDTGQTESADKSSTSVEDFSLIVDADMYQYLQKHCQKEFQNILSLYDVDVMDTTAHGVTTLFLHAAGDTKTRLGVNEQEHLKMARNAIGVFYQENENKVRRVQVPKAILPSRAELKRIIETLCISHPQVLLNEDDQNIYLIGGSSDVSDARQFLLRDHSKVRDKDVPGASDLKFPSYASGLSTHAAKENASVPLTTSPIGGFLDEKTDRLLRPDADVRRAEGAGQYKIAARFGDLGAAALGSRTADFISRTKSSTSTQSRSGPMLGHDVLSDTPKISGEAVSRAAAQNTGGDILFKGGSALPSFASLSNKTALNPDVMDVRPKTSTSPISTSQTSLSGSSPTSISPAGSGATLKRANSFSGVSQKKTQVMDQRSEESLSKSKVRSRGRSSSFSSQTPREKQQVHTAELTVFGVNWLYIKEAYRTRIDDLTSDVQMTERPSEGNRDVILTIRGAASSKVDSCQKALQSLIDSVSLDFSVQELRPSELGVADTTDETLKACFSEVCSRFKKVTIQLFKENIFLLGPEQMCTQVRALLHKMFSGDLKQASAQHHSFSLSASQGNFLPSIEKNKDQITSSQFNAMSQDIPENKMGKANGIDWNREWKTTYSNDFCGKGLVNGLISPSSIQMDPVIKEKVKITDTWGKDGKKTNNSSGSDSCAGRLNGVKSTPTWVENEGAVYTTQVDYTGQEQENNKSRRADSRSSQEGSVVLCLLCDTNPQSVKTKCGVSMCSKCQKSKHNNCRVCNETEHKLEQKPPRIHGSMKHSKLSISLPGYSKFSTIMITYRIPDGIQGESHPFPGKPFRGGVFEAYLPDSKDTKKLLPRLEKAFRQGLTFTVTGKDGHAKINWDCIPHKTSLQGGKSENGYPDSTYLKRLSEVLSQQGIEE